VAVALCMGPWISYLEIKKKTQDLYRRFRNYRLLTDVGLIKKRFE